jgi:NADPH:quinone reductase-like Zn-dependent oxidoreductase
MASESSIPSSMRAVALKRFGETPELMRLPVPLPGPGEVLVRLYAAALNPFDWTIAQGWVAGRAPHVFPLILGIDGAGVVVRCGPGVQRFQTGDEVYGAFLHPPYGRGTLAEYVAVPVTAPLALVPDTIALSAAAAAGTAGMSALALLELTHLAEGQSVLIVGAPGGVGSFATQLAHCRGARVIATAQPDAAARMRSLGASATIDHTAGPIVAQLAPLVRGGVDVLLDLVSDPGGFAANLALLRTGGHAVSTRYAATPAVLDRRDVAVMNLDLTGHHADPALLARLTAAIDRGGITIPITTELSLDDAPAALAAVHDRGARGKTLIVVNQPAAASRRCETPTV